LLRLSDVRTRPHVGKPEQRDESALSLATISADVRTRMADMGAEPVGSSAAQFGEFFRSLNLEVPEDRQGDRDHDQLSFTVC
jgi:hypothetical protein